MSVELLDDTHHSLVDSRRLAPAGGCQHVEHCVVVLVQQLHGVQSFVCAFGRGLADNVGVLDGARVYGVIGALERLVGALFEKPDNDGSLCEVVVHRVVHAFHLVGKCEAVQNNVISFKFRALIGKAQFFVGLFCTFVHVGIEYVHDVDRAHILDGVVEVLGEGFAESEVLPALGVAELALCVAHVGDFDWHVDEIFVSISADQVDRGRSDIGGLFCGGHFAVHDLAVCAM